MTARKRFDGEGGIGGLGRGLGALLVVVAVMLISILLSEELGRYVGIGLELALTRVIPTALPFMIISDIVAHYAKVEYIPLLGAAISRIFALPKKALAPLLIGNICGFPLGGKMTGEMYKGSKIDKGSAERLLAYSANPSPSFIVGAVGVGLMGDIRIGLLLLASTYLATVLSAQFFREKYKEMAYSVDNSGQKFNLVRSIKSAGEASVSISSFIIIFACLSGVVERHLKFYPAKALIISVLEVTGAVNFFAISYKNNLYIALPLIAFSLGFGGISVLMQTAAFTSEAGLSMKKYTVIKLVEGVLSAIITAACCYIFL